MCNAWNHPPGCTCGWGGDGHSGSSSGGFGSNLFFDAGWYAPPNSLESYCTPNARCPVCGKAVFYYQSEYGGRVFFDELGPPWPKHPCTDIQAFRYAPSSRNPPRPSPNQPAQSRQPFSWEQEGWSPFLDVYIARADKADVSMVKGVYGTQRVRSYVPHDNLSNSSPWHARVRLDGTLEFSTVVTSRTKNSEIVPVTLRSFHAAVDAMKYARQHRLGSGNIRVVSNSAANGGKSHQSSVKVQAASPTEQQAREILAQLMVIYPVIREYRRLFPGIKDEIKRLHSDFPMEAIKTAVALHRNTKLYQANARRAQDTYHLDGRLFKAEARSGESKPVSAKKNENSLQMKLAALVNKFAKDQ